MIKICKHCNKSFNAKHSRINNCNECFDKFIAIIFKSFNIGDIHTIAGIKTDICNCKGGI